MAHWWTFLTKKKDIHVEKNKDIYVEALPPILYLIR